jgi:glycosyltransferase involved in cell wall biosynthesis
MKRVLIWDKNAKINNSGGPAGYMWNIKQYLDANPKDEVKFYSDILNIDKPVKRTFKHLHPIRILLYILDIFRVPLAKQLLGTYFSVGNLTSEEKEKIKAFDYVHFHSVSMMNAYGKQIKTLGLKTILTTHSPELGIDEIFSGSYKYSLFLKRHKKVKNFFVKREKKYLEKADYLMYPVPQVKECFFDSDAEKIKEYLLSNQKKIFYVPTGIIDQNENEIQHSHYLDGLNIPKEAIKICYVGRHNEIKGYPYLKRIAKEILKLRRDVYFIIGGQQSEELPLEDKNWIELGWVQTKSLLKEIDYFILPNKVTYFDIIALEILRAGVPLITTYTGGNKYLSTVNTGGIQFISNDDVKEAVKAILSLVDGGIQNKGILNRCLFEKEFSMAHYIDRYVDSIQKIS